MPGVLGERHNKQHVAVEIFLWHQQVADADDADMYNERLVALMLRPRAALHRRLLHTQQLRTHETHARKTLVAAV